jgi:hypothetical protein
MRACIIGLTALAAVATASAASAADWTTYSHPELGFSIEAPAPLAVQTLSVATDVGPAPTTIFALDEGQAGAIILSVADYTGLKLRDVDKQKELDGLVNNLVARQSATLISQSPITVDGFPGREITARADPAGLLIKARIVYAGKRLYHLVAIGPAASGLPADYDRLEASLKIAKP